MNKTDFNQMVSNLATEKAINFFDRRIEGIKTLDICDVVKSKNPYLYKALGFSKAEEVVREILLAHSISSYEGIFGDAFFEPLAEELSGGHVSDAEGIDIILEDDSIYRAYAVKSGNNVFNASSKSKQNNNFESLRGRVGKRKKPFDGIVAYGYGKKISIGGKSSFREVSGQAFWKEITGDEECYLKIAEINREIIMEKRKEFNEQFEKLIEDGIVKFEEMFCDKGEIDWIKWIKYNSSTRCSKLNIKVDKKTIRENMELNIEEIKAVLLDNDDKEFDVDINDNDLKIIIESENLERNEYKITIKNEIKTEEKTKIIFNYREKTKTIQITIKPKKIKK